MTDPNPDAVEVTGRNQDAEVLRSSMLEHAPPWSTHEDPLAPARGVLIAVVLGVISWALIIFVLVR
jgi:hypothetical protein